MLGRFSKKQLEEHVAKIRNAAENKQYGVVLAQAASMVAEAEIDLGIRNNKIRFRKLLGDEATSQYYMDIADAYMAHQNFKKAIANYNRAKVIDPKNALILVSLGHAYQANGDLTKAKARYEKALEIDNDCAPAHEGLGDIYKANGQFETANNHYAVAKAIDPNRASVYVKLDNLHKDNFIQHLTTQNLTYELRKSTHNNPGNIAKFFGFHHTNKWQEEAYTLRKNALQELRKELSTLTKDQDKLDVINHAMTLPLFNEHRHNYSFTKLTADTTAIDILKEEKRKITQHLSRKKRR